MSLQLSIPGMNLPNIKSVLPKEYTGPVIRGAAVVSLESNQQEIHYQEINYEDFAIRFLSGRSIKNFEINREYNKELLILHMPKNGIRSKINNLGLVHLRQGHHLLSYMTGPNSYITLDDNTEFQLLEISYSPIILEQLYTFFPELKQFISIKKEILVGNRTFWTTPQVREIFSQLLYSDYDESLQDLYFGLKAREALFHLLHDSLTLEQTEYKFTPYEIARIYEAKSILETYINKKPPTIRQLSKMVAINEFKLKTGFRKFFHTGIFTWITAEKMFRAKKMLEETNKPIKEIAALTGYPRTTNFITAFRKQFGVTPGAIRRS